MCTVVIDVAELGGSRLLAIRDEDPARPWDSLGEWWSETHPGVIGIRDRRAGGAWLAADLKNGRLAVLLNRADVPGLAIDAAVSRGALPLDSVAGRSVPASPRMHGFNLLEVTADAARITSWDGETLRETPVSAGVHMIAHDELDDPTTPRIARWLPEFRARPARNDDWEESWVELLRESAALDPTDDRALIRDNRPHGYPTESLLYCLAEIGHDDMRVDEMPLPRSAGRSTH
ncbi:NRDE family protein [uncultured Microbacterium sp.]|uniref:NRDE family protein n=1 Tax=uncultured Microbacterium sp. TaxID=191216 RepID=UPI00262D6DAE|nr:NRDE family protein [uncultured Microbacterium sp.]